MCLKKKHCGHDGFQSFLHEVNKIVAEECTKHGTLYDLPWCKSWEDWKAKQLFNNTALNYKGRIIRSELKYNGRNVKSIAKRGEEVIALVTSSIKMIFYKCK